MIALQHRHLMAGMFRAASLVLGIPSAIAFVFLTWESVRLHLSPPDASGGATGNQMVDLFVSGFRVFGKLLALFAGVAKWVLTVLAGVSFLLVLFALILFLTGRGLDAGRPWARVVGILLGVAFMLISFVAMVALRRPLPLMLSSMTAVASAYVIWTLGWRLR